MVMQCWSANEVLVVSDKKLQIQLHISALNRRDVDVVANAKYQT